jgi:hypothetical protein
LPGLGAGFVEPHLTELRALENEAFGRRQAGCCADIEKLPLSFGCAIILGGRWDRRFPRIR